jgi:DNA helicase-2/ATP-dependent DNA helicase PcrA
VPYSYDKNESVLDKQHIHELITVTQFVASGMTGSGLKEEMLPEILSFKFWGLSRLDVWSVAEKVKVGMYTEDELGVKIYKKVSWLQAMLSSENQDIKNIANFLIEMITEAHDVPLENILDKIIGTKEYEYMGEYDEEINTKKEIKTFNSPYKDYYFGKENFDHNKPEYLEFLFALRTFIGSLREFKQGQVLKVSDLDEFLNIYKNNDNLTLTLTSPFATSNDAIVLQTAHKAKGLEYEYVFIINADEKSWNSKGYNNKIGLPENMKLLPESDNDDDKIRLFYVAATRAKHTLSISYNKEKLSYLMTDEELENREKEKEAKKKLEKENKKSPLNITKELAQNLYIINTNAFVQDEKILLKRLLENYQMPVTHFTNYLNIGKVGPDKFVEQNLLRFPQAMTSSSVYGSAMHAAMQAYYLYFKKYEKLADTEKVKEYFQNALLSGGLSEIEYQKYLISGYENLSIYIKDLESRNGGDDKPKQSDMVEYNFAREGVKIGEVNASGKIDKMQFEDSTITVTDLKTGKSFDSWSEKGGSPYDAIKLHFFKYQLAYYKLLIKNSRTYNNHKVGMGKIEFLECDDNEKINILELNLSDESGLVLCERVEKLSNIIYKKILDLDFPDVSRWTKDEFGNEKEIKLKEILEFEEALLSGNI